MINCLYVMITFLFTGLFAVQAGDIIYVKASGSNTAPYATEETAATSLATAVAYAKEQWVEGDPRPRIKIVGTVQQMKLLELSDVEIFGDGWDSATLSLQSDLDTAYNIQDNVLIHGLRLSISVRHGSCGIFVMSGSSSVISNCWINRCRTKTVNNNLEVAGHASAGLITHCLISGNDSNNGGSNDGKTESAIYGCGVVGLSGTARMVNSVFTGNYHDSNVRGPIDGTISIRDSAVLENCVIYGNYIKAAALGDRDFPLYRPRRGAGVFVIGGSPTIRNCIIRNNKMPKPYMEEPGETDIYSATEEADIYIRPGATPIIENCNMPEGQVPECAVDCQTGDPKFTDADNSELRWPDFRVSETSPCIDAGKVERWHNGATDFTGTEERYQGNGVDIGAYEFSSSETPAKVNIEMGGVLAAEKYATATMDAWAVGVKFDPAAEFKWYTSDPQTGSTEPFATGNPAEYRFTHGIHSVYLKIENADGNGTDLYASVANAVNVSRGADFYVSAKGDNANSGDIDAPFATVEKAYAAAKEIASPSRRARIKVIGTVQAQSAGVTLNNIELYGDSRTTSVWSGPPSGQFSDARITMGENSLLRDIKIDGWRSKGVLQFASDQGCVSNVWISKAYYSTSANPALSADKGLITHTLFTGCYCNYGPVFSMSGTAKMRNSVFSGNLITGMSANPAQSLFHISGNASFENNTVYGNYASKRAEGAGSQLCAGISIQSGNPLVCNNIVRNNRINTVSGDLGTGEICNFRVESGASSEKVHRNNSDEGFGENAQTADPKFTDPDADDFAIAADSPCVDAGTGKGWRTTATDHAGNPRIQGYRVDIGAYEYNSGVLNLGTTIFVR